MAIAATLILGGVFAVAAQGPVQLTAQQDRQRVMDLLQIASIPPGAPGSNNPETYNEANANPYPKLPDPLTLKNGQRVTSKETWVKQRRPEILEDFEREVYGRTPKVTPKVNWEVVSTTPGMNGDVPIITKQIVGHVDNSSYPAVTVDIQLTLVTPANAKGPVPVMMQFGGAQGGARGAAPRGNANNSGNAAQAPQAQAQTPAPAAAPAANAAPRGGGARGPQGPDWRQQVLAKGWGYANIVPNSIQADNGAGLTQGIIGLVNKGQPRKLDDWGTLAAWGWGASRALDYFETDKAVDAKQVGLEGHSRYGKATIVAMALDERFAIAYVSSSGAGGAKLHRRKYGELIENVLAANEYHWMAGNYFKYGGNWDALPVDSHQLVALIAPRPVFISAGRGPDLNPDGTIATRVNESGATIAVNINDAWVDAKGSFLAAAGAGPVYTLLGKKDMGTTEFPPIDTTLI
ncbi:MAG TPA: acetylxylan esterase, partial [Terriglobia bacterium]|nr:acetylxylan esterase [Terriglobia bacterium]